MKMARVSALVLLSFASAACEFVVQAGQSVTISMGERITGVEQMGQVRSSAGVRVEAELDPQPSPGILASHAEVSIAGGSVDGGSIVAPGGEQLRRKGSAGIFADQTLLRISGGRVRGGLVPGITAICPHASSCYALANERHGEILRRARRETECEQAMERALELYAQWGAAGKVARMRGALEKRA